MPNKNAIQLKQKTDIKRWIEPQMEFNTGIEGYQPTLSAKQVIETHKSMKVSWIWILVIMLILVSFALLVSRF